MPLRTIGKLLAATELKALAAKTRRLRELQTLYFGSAPRELACLSRVKNLQAGTLLISADNAAVAAKLRQLAPTLLASLRKSEAEVTGIRIEVQVSGARAERRERPRPKALSIDAVEKFDELAKSMEDGTLKLALQGLVRRRRREGSV